MFLPDGILLCNDKMSMAAGLELRVPFLDLELMRFVERIPARAARAPARSRSASTGGRWRGCSRPRSSNRPKHGFSTPYDDWLRASLGREVERRYAPGSALAELIDPAAAARLVDEHRRGRADHKAILYCLLELSEWHARVRRGAGAAWPREAAPPLRAQPQGELRRDRPRDPRRALRGRGPLPARPRGRTRCSVIARRAARRPRLRLVRLVAHVLPDHARVAAAQALGADHRRLRHGEHAGHRLRLPAGRPPALREPLDHAPRDAGSSRTRSTAAARSSATRRSRRRACASSTTACPTRSASRPPSQGARGADRRRDRPHDARAEGPAAVRRGREATARRALHVRRASGSTTRSSSCAPAPATNVEFTGWLSDEDLHAALPARAPSTCRHRATRASGSRWPRRCSPAACRS